MLYKLNKNPTSLMEISRNKHRANTLYSFPRYVHRWQLNTIPRSCSEHYWRGGSGTTFQQQQRRLCGRYRHLPWCRAARRAIQSRRWWLFKNRVNLPDASADWAFNGRSQIHRILLPVTVFASVFVSKAHSSEAEMDIWQSGLGSAYNYSFTNLPCFFEGTSEKREEK